MTHFQPSVAAPVGMLDLSHAKGVEIPIQVILADVTRFFAELPKGTGSVLIFGWPDERDLRNSLQHRFARTSAIAQERVRSLQKAILMIAQSSVPVICAVENVIKGPLFELVAACHLRIGTEATQFQFVDCHSGGFPSSGGLIGVLPLIGQARAMDMMLTGRALGAAEAQTIGLLQYVVPPGQAHMKALDLAAQVAANPAAVNQMILQLLPNLMQQSPETARRTEEYACVLAQTSTDAEEGYRAFLERRKPVFT